MTNTTVSGGAAALMASAKTPTSNGATAEGFSKAMRAAEVLHGVQLKGGRPSSATPAPDQPTPASSSTTAPTPSPNGTSLPLWDTPHPLGQASPNGTSPTEGALTTEGGRTTGETPVANPSIPVAGNLILIQQLTSGATPVPALATGNGAVPGASGTTSTAAASMTGGPAAGAGLRVADNLLLIQQQVPGTATASTIAGGSATGTAQAIVPGTTTTPAIAGNAGATVAASGTPTGGTAATTLASLAGAPGATNNTGANSGTSAANAAGTPGVNNPAVTNAAAIQAGGAPAPQTAPSQASTAQVTPAQTALAQTVPSQTVPAQPAAVVNVPVSAPAQPATLLPGLPVAASANASAVQAAAAVNAAVNAANTTRTANASTAQEQTVAPLSGPAPTSTAPSSSVSAPAPAAPAAPTPQPLATQVGRPMLHLAALGNGEHTVTLNVSPDNLGQVTVRAHVGSDGIRVDLFAATDSGREALKSILADLRRDLASMGGNSSLNLSGDGQPGAFGGRGFGARPQQASPDQIVTVQEPEPDVPRQTNSTSTLDLMA